MLATINTVDFLYTCPLHLDDRGFATKFKEDPEGVKGVTEEEIARVKAEWEAKQKNKSAKDRDRDKGAPERSSKDNEEQQISQQLQRNSHQTIGSRATTLIHDKYSLHRDFFAMRQAEYRKRRQVAQAKALAPCFPGAPLGQVKDD